MWRFERDIWWTLNYTNVWVDSRGCDLVINLMPSIMPSIAFIKLNDVV